MKNLFLPSSEVAPEVPPAVQLSLEGRLAALSGICIEKSDPELNLSFQVPSALIFFSSHYLVRNDIDLAISCIHRLTMAPLGAKYWKYMAVAPRYAEDEINTIRDRLSRRIREPDHVITCAASKDSKRQHESKRLVDVHTLRKKLSEKLKKRSLS